MKLNKKTLCLLLALVLVFQAMAMLVGCDKPEEPGPNGPATSKLDNETSPLVFSTEPLDGVFNPFSYTSGADGGVVGETQLGMLTTDKFGNLVAGWDQPTVAEAFSFITVGTEDDFRQDGDYTNYYTDYYFAIKDGIKFSDGTELTMKDVLFNLYVNLDPVYTGSSTMYSIDIQGLSAYRTQSPDENAQENLNNAAETNAVARWQNLIAWCQSHDSGNPTLEDYFAGEQLAEVKADIAKIKELFKDELNSDWTAAGSMLEEYEKYYQRTDETDAIQTGAEWAEYTKEGNTNKHVTEQWEIFLMMYGQITTATQKFDDDGTKKYTFEYNGADQYAHDKDSLINRVYTDFFPSDENGTMFKQKLLQVITLYNTSNTYFEYALAAEKGKLLNVGDGTLAFPSISGITTYYANSIPQEDGKQPINFDGNRHILKIRINGVDPKAKYSFGFTVAPMHYYSTQEAMNKFVKTGEVDDGNGNMIEQWTGFGVEYANTEFMRQLNTKLVPLGAGAYRASNGTSQGIADNATTSLKISEFYSNNIVNFERNNYFYTVMKDGHNANIKFLRYKVIPANSMVNAVVGKNPEVYMSMPTATKETRDEIAKYTNVKEVLVDNMGYGYIGVNASKVKDLNVRRAIMHAMNVELCRDYYQDDNLVDIIYRSMSKNNWAYPNGLTGSYYEFDESGATSLALVQEAGYWVDSKTGILTNADGEKLKFTFTVAGETEDHPAYQTMIRAATILNNIGFDVTVTKDSLALTKLASGQLEVWAAAWSSGIDPDMYQVYHKDSTASSVKNWGYPHLLREGTTEENDILDRLAEQIELGRKYLDEASRKPYYEEALDLVMELAVELPTYQRKNMYLINTDVIDASTLTEANVYQSPVSEIWNLSFVGQSK